ENDPKKWKTRLRHPAQNDLRVKGPPVRCRIVKHKGHECHFSNGNYHYSDGLRRKRGLLGAGELNPRTYYFRLWPVAAFSAMQRYVCIWGRSGLEIDGFVRSLFTLSRSPPVIP